LRPGRRRFSRSRRDSRARKICGRAVPSGLDLSAVQHRCSR
jgi:hypothetical protein